MDSYIRFSSPTINKRLITFGVIALIATAITIGVVITIKITHKSSTVNSLKNGKLKIKFIEPQWIPFVNEDKSLEHAFVAGASRHSRSIYVCRVNSTKSPEILPGIFDPDITSCEVTYGGISYKYDNFEILIAKDPSVFVWESDASGHAPIGALIGGLASWQDFKDELQISRAEINFGKYIGKVHGRHSKAYVAYEGRERTVPTYEVLCLQDYSLG